MSFVAALILALAIFGLVAVAVIVFLEIIDQGANALLRAVCLIRGHERIRVIDSVKDIWIGGEAGLGVTVNRDHFECARCGKELDS